MIAFPRGTTAAAIESSTRGGFPKNSSPINETNLNKTKDFDLRQEDSVVYQRSRAGTDCEHTHRKNVRDGCVLGVAGPGWPPRAGSNR